MQIKVTEFLLRRSCYLQKSSISEKHCFELFSVCQRFLALYLVHFIRVFCTIYLPLCTLNRSEIFLHSCHTRIFIFLYLAKVAHRAKHIIFLFTLRFFFFNARSIAGKGRVIGGNTEHRAVNSGLTQLSPL